MNEFFLAKNFFGIVQSLLFIEAGAGEKNTRSRSKKDRLHNTGYGNGGTVGNNLSHALNEKITQLLYFLCRTDLTRASSSALAFLSSSSLRRRSSAWRMRSSVSFLFFSASSFWRSSRFFRAASFSSFSLAWLLLPDETGLQILNLNDEMYQKIKY